MPTHSRFAFRSLAASLPLMLCAVALLFVSHPGAAQTESGSDNSDHRGASGSDPQQNTNSGKTDRSGTDNKTTDSNAGKKKPNVPPPGNPLVKVNPNDGSGNDLKEYNKDGTRKQPRRWTPSDYGDYRANPDDPRNAKRTKNLPIFGYDFFDWPRQYRIAQRASLMRQYPGLLSNNGQKNRRGASPRRGTGTENGDTDSEQNPTTHTRRPRTGDQDTQSNDTTGNDSTGTNYRTRKSNSGADSNSDGSDMNSDTGNNNDRSTRADDDNADDTASRPRRSARNTDDQTDNTDMSDDQNGGPRNTDGYQGTRDANGNTDDTSDLSSSSDDEARHEELLNTNRRRALLGLDPLTDDTQGDTGIRRSTRNNGLDGYSTDRYGANRNSRTNADGTDYYSDYPNGRNSGRSTSRTQDDSREPVDAYSQIADPLTMLTRNITSSVPPNYQLSGGDKVVIRYSNPAMTQRESTHTVDAQGALNLDEVGHINVAGMTLEAATKEIKRRLEHLYKRVEVSLSLRELRTISVTVGGKAFLPGTYNVPAAATAFNVLYIAGGPTRDGSLRNIQIRRQNHVFTLDFYKMMAISAAPTKADGTTDYQADIPLQSGDVIFIPSYHERVAVQGEVREAAYFELKEGETLQDALKFAGGVKGTGVTQHVQVNTVDPGKDRVIKDVDLKDAAGVSKLALYDGDVINVPALRTTVANKVTIVGAVAQPSDYALTPNMKVGDLVRAAGNTLSEAYLGHAAIYRWNPNGTTTMIPIDLSKALDGDPQNDQPLMKWDQVEIYSRQEAFFTGNRKLTVRGAVQYPGIYAHAENMHVSDLLYKVGGTLPDAEMVVVEHQHGDGTKQYQYVSVADVVHGNTAKDITLEDNDIVGIYRNGETGFIPEHKVMVRGAVQTEGLYDRGEGMHLSDLIKLAGNFKPDSGDRVIVAHARRPADGVDASIRTVAVVFDAQHRCAPQDDIRLEDGDEVLVQGRGGFEDKPGVVFIDGAVDKTGPFPITSKKMYLTDLIAQAKLRPEAFKEGAQFYRDPKLLGTQQQRDMASVVSDLSDLNNASAYKRELAKSDLERIRASGSASSQSSPLSPGAAAPNPAAAALAIELSKHDLVSKPRTLGGAGLEPNGNIAVNLVEAMKKPHGPDDILLMDGDHIKIPETPTTVNIYGAVVNPRGVLFKQGAPLAYYVAEAGGFAPDANRDQIVVIHANGGMTPGNQARTLRTGDVIIVPTRVMSEKLPNPNNGVGNIFSSLLSGALVFRLFGL